jgi:hypothetical protein
MNDEIFKSALIAITTFAQTCKHDQTYLDSELRLGVIIDVCLLKPIRCFWSCLLCEKKPICFGGWLMKLLLLATFKLYRLLSLGGMFSLLH